MMDRKTRKTMTMYGALHPKSDIHRIYLPREKGGRGLISCEDCISCEENNLGWYIKNSVEPFLEGVKVAVVIEVNDAIHKEEYKKRRREEKQKGWRESNEWTICKRHGQWHR